MKRCVFYLRYSSAGQTEQSIEGQEHVCDEFCKHNGYFCVNKYIDRALTGTSDNRAAFQQMIKDSKSHDWEYVIVYKLDRFARNRYDSATYKRALKQNGVKVISAMENISDTPEGVILEAVIEGYAEYYSLNLSQNVLRGLRESASKGLCLGGHPPYGYKFENKHVVIEESEARLLKRFFEGIANGRAQLDICRQFNEEGYRARNGKPFTKDTFYTALRNRKYIGEYEYRGEKTSIYPPILDKDLFECVQNILGIGTRVAPLSANTQNYLLRGKIFCGECDSRGETTPLVCDCGTSKNGIKYRYYSCAVHKRKPSNCKKMPEPLESVEDFVVRSTIDFLSNDDVFYELQKNIKEIYEKRYNNKELDVIIREITLTKKEYERYLDKYVNETEPRAITLLKERMKYLDDRLHVLENELATTERCLKMNMDGEKIAVIARSYLDGDPLDPAYRTRLINTFVSKVFVYENRYIVYYNVTGYDEEDKNAVKRLELNECSSQATTGRLYQTLFEHEVSFTEWGVWVVFPKIG